MHRETFAIVASRGGFVDVVDYGPTRWAANVSAEKRSDPTAVVRVRD